VDVEAGTGAGPGASSADAARWRAYLPVDPAAPEALLRRLTAAGEPHELRAHEPARHARHLAALWNIPLHEAIRATLFYASPPPGPPGAPEQPGPPGAPEQPGQSASGPAAGVSPAPVLVLVPADRKIAAPRLRELLGAADLRVLRADRGVGRVGWRGLPGAPGALPAVPGLFGARLLVDALVLRQRRVVLTLEPGRSLALSPQALLRPAGGQEVSTTGRTRLLPGGGMVRDP
jgi:hypothetical protein